MIFIGVLFFLIGLGVLVSGIFSVFKVRRALAASVKTSGTVTGFGQISGKSGYLYCPQVKFQIQGGQQFKFQSEFGTQPPSYTVGQKVPVVYQFNNPNKAEIDSAQGLWFVPGCTIVMALFFTGLGAMLFGIGVFVEIQK